VEPKHAFTFNDTRFKMGHCANGSKVQKFVSFTPVVSGKSVCTNVPNRKQEC